MSGYFYPQMSSPFIRPMEFIYNPTGSSSSSGTSASSTPSGETSGGQSFQEYVKAKDGKLYDPLNPYEMPSMINWSSEEISLYYKERDKQIEEYPKAVEERKNAMQGILNEIDNKETKDAIEIAKKEQESIEKTKVEKNGEVTATLADIAPAKQSTWDKVKRFGKNTMKAFENVWDGMTKDPKTGKWDWWRIAKSAGTIAAVWILPRALDCVIPGAGAVVTTGLLAAGLGMGAIGTATNTYKWVKANKNDQEAIDKAQQGFVLNFTTAVLSAWGLKGITNAAKTAVLNNAASTAQAGTAVQGANAAAQGARTTAEMNNILSNAGFKMSNNGAMNYLYDISVNAVKATKMSVTEQQAAAAAARAAYEAAGSSKTAAFFKGNYTAARSNMTSLKDMYNNKRMDSTESALGDGIANANKTLADIKGTLPTTNPSVYDQEILASLNECQAELSTNFGKTLGRENYVELFNNSKNTGALKSLSDRIKLLDTMAADPAYAADKIQITKALETLQGIESSYASNISNLVKLKQANIEFMMKNPKLYQSELDAYFPGAKTRNLKEYWNWGLNKYQAQHYDLVGKGRTGKLAFAKYLKPAKWAWDGSLVTMNLPLGPLGALWRLVEYNPWRDNYTQLGEIINDIKALNFYEEKAKAAERLEKNLVKANEYIKNPNLSGEEYNKLIQEITADRELIAMNHNEFEAAKAQAEAQAAQLAQQQAQLQAQQQAAAAQS